jgi:hypothetical protein
MKMLRILARIGITLFVIWGLVALFHTMGRQPGQRPFFFWLVLPYPVLIALTMAIIVSCARNSRPSEARFSWFAVGVGAAASIGLAMAAATALSSIISWAYSGRVSLTYEVPTDPEHVAFSYATSAACYIWAGAISAALGSQRPLPHALTAGAVLLVWSCATTLLTQPPVVSQLLVALVLPIPLAAWGSRLRQARVATVHG